MILEIKVGSSLAFSRSSRHTFTRRCFSSFVKNRGTSFAAMRRMFRSPGKLHNWHQRRLRAHVLFGEGLRAWFLDFLNIFRRFACAWSPWTFFIFNWHSTGLETWMSLRNRCPAYRMFYKSLTKHFKGFSSGFTELHAKIDVNTLFDFAIHRRQNETRSRKSTRVKTLLVHSVVTRGRLMQ
jgi:hypothetical protein